MRDEVSLFWELGAEEEWKEHWKDMPEFVQEDQQPFKQLIVSFEKPEDFRKFCELIGQKLTSKTKSIWYPKVDIEVVANKRYLNSNNSIDEA